MIRLDTATADFGDRFAALVAARRESDADVARDVAAILARVRAEGDAALADLTQRFDRHDLDAGGWSIERADWAAAHAALSPELRAALELAAERIASWHLKQLPDDRDEDDGAGIRMGARWRPVDAAGIYVPGGRAAYPSSVLMNAIPAKAAGVKRLVMVTPTPDGIVNPLVLAAAHNAGVDELWRVGGAQAIAALAFGTKTIPKVDKIVGPGNAYVTEAKRQVFGYCDIDMLAGPTEVVIIANQLSDINFIRADLEAQSEHFMGLSILITNSKRIAKALKKESIKGYIVPVKNMEEAAEAANMLAPEHLQILTNNPKKIARKIDHAGAIFLGPYTPVAVGDYVAGPSHVLPTGGSARFFSGLGLSDFYKSSHMLSYTKNALEKIREPLEKVAGIEKLQKHLDSVRVRFE